MNHLLTLEVGCGSVNDIRFDEKVDLNPHPYVTYNTSMTNMPRYGDSRFCVIKSSASLEHLNPTEQVKAVKEFHRILCNGGVVIVQTPDKKYWTERLNSNDQHEREWANVQMTGGMRDEHDYHEGLLDADSIRKLFEENRFRTLYLRDGNQAAGSLDAGFECVKGGVN